MNEKEISLKTAKLVVNSDYNIQNPKDRYSDAVANRTFLLGEYYEGVDWSTYNLVLSTAKFKQCETGIEYLRQFWKHVYPYINHLLQDWKNVTENYWDVQADSDKVLKNYADLMHEKKLMEVCLKENNIDYNKWLEEFNAKS